MPLPPEVPQYKVCLVCEEKTLFLAPGFNHKPGCPELLGELTAEAQSLGLYDSPEELAKRQALAAAQGLDIRDVQVPEEPTPAIHDPTPEPPAAEPEGPGPCPAHWAIGEMADTARDYGCAFTALTVDKPTFAKLKAEMTPEERESAAHRWEPNELRFQTCLGWVKVYEALQ